MVCRRMFTSSSSSSLARIPGICLAFSPGSAICNHRLTFNAITKYINRLPAQPASFVIWFFFHIKFPGQFSTHHSWRTGNKCWHAKQAAGISGAGNVLLFQQVGTVNTNITFGSASSRPALALSKP